MPGLSDKIAYSPLGQSSSERQHPPHREASQLSLDDDELVDNDDEEDDEDLDQNEENLHIFSRCGESHEASCWPREPLHPLLHPLASHANFRVVLFLVAIFLSLIFLVQLFTSTSTDTSNHQPQALKLALQANNPTSAGSSIAGDLSMLRPKYDSYLASILSSHNQNLAVEPPDDLTDPASTKDTGAWWRSGTSSTGKFVTLTDYIRAMKSFNHNSSVTLTTQATTEFMHHTLELCKRWDGPLSVAVFSPGRELAVTVTLIKFMRHCLPAPLSACIRDKVTWHLAYNRAHGPPVKSMRQPYWHLDADNFGMFVHQDLCPKFAGPEPEDLIKQFEVELRKKNDLFPNNYRKQFHLTYPINVLRNTARLAAKTKFVLASDIELYPSKNLVPAFANYMQRHDVRDELSLNHDRYIFTLPIFEVRANLSAPKTKSELIELFNQESAIFFHKWVCDACQNFPDRQQWLEMSSHQDDPSEDDELVIFRVTRRDKTRSFWEPIFIGTNQDPLYDERLTWDGRRDKMGQMYEMCLQDYRLLVLANAFLVHAPGIKLIDRNDTMKRLKYLQENNAIYDQSIARLHETYSNSSNIEVC